MVRRLLAMMDLILIKQGLFIVLQLQQPMEWEAVQVRLAACLGLIPAG
jgi:hypothetical protein